MPTAEEVSLPRRIGEVFITNEVREDMVRTAIGELRDEK
jgi:hypothetical protein